MKRMRLAQICKTTTSTLKKSCDYYTSITGIPVPEDVPEPIASQLEQAFALSKSDEITLRTAIIRVVGEIEKPVEAGSSEKADRRVDFEGRMDELTGDFVDALIRLHNDLAEKIQDRGTVQISADIQVIRESLHELADKITKNSNKLDEVIDEIETIHLLQKEKTKPLSWWPW